MAPTHTSLQPIFASGSTLNIAPNSSVMTANVSRKLRISPNIFPSPPNSAPPTAVNAAVTASETSSRNAMPSTMPSEKRRFVMKFLMPPLFGSGSTSHARLSAVWSETNAPVAPNRSPPMLRISRNPEPDADFCSAVVIMVSTCLATSLPISAWNWPVRASRTCAGSQMKLAT